MLEHIMGYFGTYTPAADGAIATFQFEYLTTLGFAAIVIFLGRAIVAHSALLRKYAIPAPVISGIIFSVVVSIIKGSGIIGFSFDAKIVKDLCQNLFFLCVGFGFSYKMLKHAGGKLCIAIAVAACVLITLQDVVGYLVGSAIGLHPLLALQCSSSAMSGGVGTASAFGPIFENMGAPDATTVGVAAGTMGNIMGSLIGGPVAAFLISRHGLKSDPNDRPESAKAGSAAVLNNTRMIKAFALSLLVAALGMPIYCLLDNIPMIEIHRLSVRRCYRKKHHGCSWYRIPGSGDRRYRAYVPGTLPGTGSDDHRYHKASSGSWSDGYHPPCAGYPDGTLCNLRILQRIWPRLRCSCYGSW